MKDKIMKILKRLIQFLKESNRWKHLIGGVVIGLGANDIYCAAYASIGIASALELKDYLWGGKPDVFDAVTTIIGTSLGFAIRSVIIKFI